MDRIKSEAFRLDCPYFADLFVGREALEPLGKVVGHDEVGAALGATGGCKIEAVTGEQVKAVAQRLLDPAKMTFVVVGKPAGL